MASYSPTFVLDVSDAVSAGQTATITGLNQSFHLVNVLIDGNSGSIAFVKNSGATAAVAYVAGQTVGAMDSSTRLFNTNCTFAANAAITIEILGSDASRIQLFCRAIDSLARNITVSVA